jgi:hypothetical protein
MTQEEKELLLKDLSARLPYEVKVQYNNEIYNVDYISVLYEEVKLDIPDNYTVGISEIKPYLRPMSSMTEEENVEYYNTMDKETQRNYPNSCDFSESVYYSNTIKTFDWLNAHHFDYRGLIEKGLAIAVDEENNPYKE